MQRVQSVRQFRLASKSLPSQKIAQSPTRFDVENMLSTDSLLIPGVSSERRAFVPIGFISPDVLISNLTRVVPNATPYDFGILSSTMHNACICYTYGRLKSDFRYSASIVYNNYPWPMDITDAQRAAVNAAAQGVLDAWAVHQHGDDAASLADLYNPTTMPANLNAAHKALDKAVDAGRGKKGSRRMLSGSRFYSGCTRATPAC